MPNIENSYIEKILFSEINQNGIELFIKREDLIHPFISGNKYRKLKYNLEQAKLEEKDCLLTFGGAFSNHIAAVAAAGKKYGFETIGVIRGDELVKDIDKTLESNATLRFAYECGMQFKFVSREDYKTKNQPAFISKLQEEFGNFYLIPEGGTNALAVKGCEEILDEETDKFDYICVSVGTGGTVVGIINASRKHQQVIGFSALKGGFLRDEIQEKIKQSKHNWTLNTDYHFGGYAKTSDELISFINKFKKETKIQLDPIYTGKMAFGVVDMINNNYFASGSKILLIHTGGLQGIEGVNAVLRKKNSITLE